MARRKNEPTAPLLDDNGNASIAAKGVSLEEGDVRFTELMPHNFLVYAVSVLTDRALPDIRDGLLPVQRRILLAMRDQRLWSNGGYRKSAKVVGECFVEGALVHTPSGLRRIETLKPGELVLTPTGKPTVIETTFENPPQALVDVRLSNGNTITTTPGQLFRVVNEDYEQEWVRADELTLEQKILSVTSQDDAVHSPNCRAYAFGLLTSEGYPHDRRFRDRVRALVTMTDREPLEYVERNLDGLQSCRLRTEKQNSPGLKQRYTLALVGDESLLDACWPHSAQKVVPDEVMRDETMHLDFIAGFLDGDGYVRADREEIVLTTTSIEMTRQLQALLLAHGIHSWRGVHSKPQPEHHALLHAVRISGESALAASRLLLDRVHVVRKQQALQDMLHRDHKRARRRKSTGCRQLPARSVLSTLSAAHRGGGWFEDTQGRQFRARLAHEAPAHSKFRYSADRFERTITVATAEQDDMTDKLRRIGAPLGDRLDALAGATFVQVKEVTPHPQERVTYDIQVADAEHAFIVEGCVVHNCMGNYHPHGDMAIYGALVRMAQDFSLRVPLVDGHGNFGNLDGDGAAASRYTECRMSPMAEQLLRELDPEVLPDDYGRNYDETRPEPHVLPAAYPNLLINGNIGIAVGMTCRILPHNPGEILDLAVWRLNNPDAPDAKLVDRLSGPDFPTGAVVVADEGLRQSYLTGEGKVIVRGEAHIEPAPGNREKIVITSLPYGVSKGSSGSEDSGLLQVLNKLYGDGRAEGKTPSKFPEFAEMADLSDKSGVRIEIELKRGANAKAVLQRIYKYTRLQMTYGVAMNVLVGGQPRTVNLPQMLDHFLDFRRYVLIKIAEKRIREIETRLHKLDALLKALSAIDAVVETIKKSKDRAEAKPKLIKLLKIDEQQAEWIVEMQLGSLTALDQYKLKEEVKTLRTELKQLQKFVKTPALVTERMIEDFRALKKVMNSPRQTRVIGADAASSEEDLLSFAGAPAEDCILLVSRNGQALCGQGTLQRGASLALSAGDRLVRVEETRSDQERLVFTASGKCFRLRLAELPLEAKRHKGAALSSIIGLEDGDAVVAVHPVPAADTPEQQTALFVYRSGTVKRTAWSEFAAAHSSGVVAAKPVAGDEVIEVFACTDDDEVLLVGSHGKAIRFAATDCRPMGRAANGVRGINLPAGAEIRGSAVLSDASDSVLLLTTQDQAKRLSLSDLPSQGRGGGGVVLMKDKNGEPRLLAVAPTKGEIYGQAADGKLKAHKVSSVPAVNRANIPRNWGPALGIVTLLSPVLRDS